MPATYEKIATTTLSSAANTITFNSIAASWTDLRLVLVGKAVSAGGDIFLNFNNDSTALYSSTRLFGDGATATSNRQTGQTQIVSSVGFLSSQPCLYTFDIFSYAGSTNKTTLITLQEDANGSGYTGRFVGLYRSTSAITRIDINYGSGTGFAIGTTATIYGILKA